MATYKTTRGKFVDIDAFRTANEKELAAGNMSVNARGDEVRGGKIVRSAASRVKEYYKDNPNAVKNVSIKKSTDEMKEASKKTVKIVDTMDPEPEEIIRPVEVVKPKAPDVIEAKPKSTKKNTRKK